MRFWTRSPLSRQCTIRSRMLRQHRLRMIPERALLDGLINSCFSTAQALLTAHSELLRMAQQATANDGMRSEERAHPGFGRGAGQHRSRWEMSRVLLSELAQPTERLPFNVLCRGPQKFDWAEIPMAEIVAVKEACGATVNDVVLTVLSMALRRYAELHKLEVKGRKLRLVIPVNVRPNGECKSRRKSDYLSSGGHSLERS